MNKLLPLGWPESQPLTHHEKQLARITMTGQNTYQGISLAGHCQLKLTGKLSHTITEKYDLPAVGDWVVTDDHQQVIEQLLPRRSSFVRNVAGNRDERQVIAANVDEIWLIMSVNHDLNLARLHRYVLNAWDSGGLPVIILTKVDLTTEVAPFIDAIQAEHPGIECFTCSALTGAGLEALKERLVAYRTIALVGSSGVGKSTLINRLAGRELQLTGEIREDDSRGRHTTTSRHLLNVHDAWLVDTPGMREFGVWSTTEQLDQTFHDISELADTCRFNDCRHQTEPGCAITQALKDGRLPTERYRAYQKLQRELAYLAKRQRENELKKQR